MSFPIDPESAVSAAQPLESLTQSVQRSVTTLVVAEENRLLIAALAKASGVECPNPYDFIGRLAKNENAQGTTILFDKSAILWIGRASTDFANDRITVNVPYRMLGAALD